VLVEPQPQLVHRPNDVGDLALKAIGFVKAHAIGEVL
jgi:hypothetical protein